MWQSLSLERLNIMIEHSGYLLNDSEERFWDFIKIAPEKWQERTHGKESGGFWVVAIFGNQILYYNDIEEGFNVSNYQRYGFINEYQCSQLELHESVSSLHEWLFKGL